MSKKHKCNWLKEKLNVFFFKVRNICVAEVTFTCDLLHARLNSHYEAWGFKKKKYKKIKVYRKSDWKETIVKKVSVNFRQKAI